MKIDYKEVSRKRRLNLVYREQQRLWKKEWNKKNSRKHQAYYRENREKIIAYQQEYNKDNKDKILLRQKEYYIKYPWAKTLQSIIARCTNKKNWYYIRGIKNFLTTKDLKFVWFRDKAYLMDKPNIHRIKKGHYIFENVRFIEMEEHLKIKKEKWN